MTVHPLPPRKLGCGDYARLGYDHRRREILDGALFVSGPPNLYHQTVARRLLVQLFAQVEERGCGLVFHAPTEVHLGDHDVLVPDLLVVRRGREHVLTPTKVRGAPDLVIEVLSAGDQVDRARKKDRCAANGVPEYWLVEPEEHAVEQWRLTGNGYECAAVCDERIEPRGFPDVAIDLRRVWGP